MLSLKEIRARHQQYLENQRIIEQANSKGSDLVALARDFILEISEAGSNIRSTRERETLLAIIRYWAVYVDSKTNQYPNTELAPFVQDTSARSSILAAAASILFMSFAVVALIAAIKYAIPDSTSINPLSVTSILVSAGTVVFLVLYRRQIAAAALPLIEHGVEFVTRASKGLVKSAPTAFLMALAGVDSGRTQFDLYGTTPIGRSRRHAELIFQAEDEDSPISRLHCTILEDDGAFSIRDEDSQWGTYLNNKKLEALTPEVLHDGDEIELGQVERGGIRFRFALSNPSADNEFMNSDDKHTVLEEPEGRITHPRRR